MRIGGAGTAEVSDAQPPCCFLERLCCAPWRPTWTQFRDPVRARRVCGVGLWPVGGL